jgi:hypothetical protein
MPTESKNAGVTLAKGPPLPQELQPQMLDLLTVTDDKTFLDRVREKLNLPEYVKKPILIVWSTAFMVALKPSLRSRCFRQRRNK